MPQCKLDRCKEQARPYGKRYCQKHYEEYVDKQARYRAEQLKRPKCASCNEHISKTEDDAGMLMCSTCSDAEEARQAADDLSCRAYSVAYEDSRVDAAMDCLDDEHFTDEQRYCLTLAFAELLKTG